MLSIKSTKILLWFKVILFIVSVYIAYTIGYSLAETRKDLFIRELELSYRQEKDRLLKQLNGIQQKLYATEKAWLEEKTKMKIAYKDNKEAAIKTVNKYVQDNNFDKCSIGTDGMHKINKAILTGLNPNKQKDKDK